MMRNKPRIQLALYARPRYPGTYHYALFVTPKIIKAGELRGAQKHHVKNTLQNIDGEVSQPWRYECLEIPAINLESRLLVYVTLGKIQSLNELQISLESVRIYQ